MKTLLCLNNDDSSTRIFNESFRDPGCNRGELLDERRLVLKEKIDGILSSAGVNLIEPIKVIALSNGASVELSPEQFTRLNNYLKANKLGYLEGDMSTTTGVQ